LSTPKLSEDILEPERARDVPADLVPRYIGSLAQLLSSAEVAMGALSHRLRVVFNGKELQTQVGDRLLDVHEAAKKLGRSSDWLNRRARKLPFTRPDGRSLQFSEEGE